MGTDKPGGPGWKLFSFYPVVKSKLGYVETIIPGVPGTLKDGLKTWDTLAAARTDNVGEITVFKYYARWTTTPEQDKKAISAAEKFFVNGKWASALSNCLNLVQAAFEAAGIKLEIYHALLNPSTFTQYIGLAGIVTPIVPFYLQLIASPMATWPHLSGYSEKGDWRPALQKKPLSLQEEIDAWRDATEAKLSNDLRNSTRNLYRVNPEGTRPNEEPKKQGKDCPPLLPEFWR